ncbi:MAG: hypothetical protein ACETWM_18110 [Candidatus Lokiarchaeia archaeon]
MNFWDETSIGKVYGRLRILAVIVGIPGVASFLQLISLDSYKFFLFFQTKPTLPALAVFISPLEVTVNWGYDVPTGNPYTLLLTAIFLASFAGVAFLNWCMFFVRAARYTPGYNTFGDVKRAIRSLLPGARKGQENDHPRG